MFCAGRAANPRWRKAAVCALSAAASILLMLSVSLSLESELKPLDGKTAEVTGVVTEKKSGNLYEAYGSVSTEAGSAEHIKFTLWNALSDELEAGDSFRCTARVTYDDPYTSEYRSSAGESRFLFCATGEEIELLGQVALPGPCCEQPDCGRKQVTADPYPGSRNRQSVQRHHHRTAPGI